MSGANFEHMSKEDQQAFLIENLMIKIKAVEREIGSIKHMLEMFPR